MTRSDGTGVVVMGFDDLLRAEQAARAADLWRSANRSLPVGPIMVVGRTVSGAVVVETRGVIPPRAGARRGFLIGLGLAGLPAAGIGAFLGWLVGVVVTALLTLTGLIQDGTAIFITIALAVGGAAVLGLLVGLLGGLLGTLTGAVVGLIDSRTRGFSGSEVGKVAAGMPSGDAIVAVSAGVPTIPLVTDELARLGGTPRPANMSDGGQTEERGAPSP
jgi:hypothetical protein